MTGYTYFLDMLRRGEPFAFARFNYCEMDTIMGTRHLLCRGKEIATPDMRAALKRCLMCRAPNYWVGVPCNTCSPERREIADSLVDGYERVRCAVTFTNRNLATVRKEFPLAVAYKQITWVGCARHNVKNLPFIVEKVVSVPDRQPWLDHGRLDRMSFLPGKVVLLSCGILATVMACDWFGRFPKTTFIDIGSVWEPETTGKRFNCHKGTLPPCAECN